MTHSLSMLPEAIADRDLRLECARIKVCGRLEDAQDLYAWVTGAADQTPEQRIRTAVAEIEALSSSGGR